MVKTSGLSERRDYQKRKTGELCELRKASKRVPSLHDTPRDPF
jgi:hypothetical protein